MPLMFHNRAPLFVNGKPAMSEKCCCECLPSPETVEFTITFSLSTGTGYQKDLSALSCSQLEDHKVDAVYLFSFVSGGVTTSVSSIENKQIPGGDCGSNMTPHLGISASSGGTMGPFVYTFTAVLVRKGALSVSFKPFADTFATIIDGRCAEDKPKYLRATPSLAIGGIPGVTSHNPGWNENNEVYTTPFTHNWNF